VNTLVSGLALKEQKNVIDLRSVQSEKGLRSLIERNLKKDIHPGTKPSIDFIYKILEDAYTSGMHYDVTDMRPTILAFANNSSHQPDTCISLVNKMKFKSEESAAPVNEHLTDDIVFFDVEVFPNLFVVVWKTMGKKAVKMINPSPSDIEELLRHKLVGFNCRRYDNHILYARLIGFNNHQLYQQSQRLISNSRNAGFGEAYNVSYTDIYDFSSKKQSLKKWEIELGIHHKELGLPWTEPVPEEKWDMVADYCVDDVTQRSSTQPRSSSVMTQLRKRSLSTQICRRCSLGMCSITGQVLTMGLSPAKVGTSTPSLVCMTTLRFLTWSRCTQQVSSTLIYSGMSIPPDSRR
jgi:hypothetical protein